MLLKPRFWDFFFFKLEFFKIDEILLKFWLVFEDLILKTSYIALHLHYNSIIMHLDVCNLCMSHVHAFSMYLYVFSHILIIVNCFRNFLIVFFSLPFLLVMLVVSMAPKCKSTLARNPFHSDAFSSSDHAPFSLCFCNDDAHKAFTENFSRRGIHSER